MLRELKINRERMEAAATDLAEYLVKKECHFARRTRSSANWLRNARPGNRAKSAAIRGTEKALTIIRR